MLRFWKREIVRGTRTSLYRCPACWSAGVSEAPDAITCDECGKSYPVIERVPLLVRDFRVEPSGFVLGDEVAAAICPKFGLEPDPATLEALGRIVARRYEVGDVALTAENNYLLNRVELSDGAYRLPLRAKFADAPVNADIVYSIDRHYVPSVLRPGDRTSANVRLTNRGRSVISSKAGPPVNLAYRWFRPDGSPLVLDGVRTSLLIELMPGQSITMPLQVETPPDPGPAVLEILLVHESVAWLDRGAARHRVELSAERGGTSLADDWRSTGVSRGGYVEDHHAALALVKDELGPTPSPETRILEVAGTASPMSALLPGEVINTDIDIQSLQLGHLSSTRAGRAVRHVCADALNLPFQDGSFDWVLIFAALHHLTDPAAALAEFHRVLKPGGRAAVMSEPMGHDMATEEIIGQLEYGINEQVFSLAEYATMFDRAGFALHRLQIDIGSLKVILRAA